MRTPIWKRPCDVGASLVLVVLLGPLMAFIACAILITSGAPVLFRQERVGLGGRSFTILKYRTMRAPRTAGEAATSADVLRVTAVGRALRATSLDELPQLINVLRGDMSIIGPRPTLRDQVDRYTDFQRRRLLVRPGITGWAQVNGRNALAWSKRIELDVWYVEHLSVMLDVRILLRTLPTALRREGLYGQDGINPDLDE